MVVDLVDNYLVVVDLVDNFLVVADLEDITWWRRIWWVIALLRRRITRLLRWWITRLLWRWIISLRRRIISLWRISLVIHFLFNIYLIIKLN